MPEARLSFLVDNQPQERSLVGEELSIGRSPQMQFSVPESIAGISRHHATLRRKGSRWWVEDAGTRNGTFVNQSQFECEPLEPVRLKGKTELIQPYRVTNARGAT